jgi:hypothetical protein
MKQEKLTVVDGLRNKKGEFFLPITRMAEAVVKTAVRIAYAPIKAAEILSRRKS